MKKEIQSLKLLWKTDKLHLIIIFYFVFAYSWIYRVALRTFMDGAPFKWANTVNTQGWGEIRNVHIYGSGIDGHFVIILLLCLFFLALTYLLVRRPDAFTKTIILCWTSLFVVWQLIVATGLGTDYTLSGDTFGVVLPYYIIGPLEQIVLLILIVIWIFRNKTIQLVFPKLSHQQKKEILYIIATLPVTFLLFRFGEQDGTTDQLGIIALYVQFYAMLITLVSVQAKENLS